MQTHNAIDRLGIERLCVFGLPPIEFVTLAADLNCRYIGIGLEPMRYNPYGYAPWSLRKGPALRREMIAAMRDRNVSISLCEGFGVSPKTDVRDYAADLDALRELGGTRINVTSMDRDVQRTLDQFAIITAMAETLGIETTIEIGPGPISGLPTALDAVRYVARPNFKLLIDTMHFVRGGAGAADIRALDPSVIGYVQLCDVPLVSKHSSYMEEALYERLPPGAGELPLVEILAALPEHVVLGLEVPQRSLVEAGVGPHERVGGCIKSALELLARVTRG